MTDIINKANPIVSICCITYNHEKYITQTIKGFLLQKTNFPIEIIIHDDASTDNTAGIVQEFANEDSRIIPILRNENIKSKGMPIFPITFEKAKGKYIAMCEGDDYWTDPNKLQEQIDFLEANPNYAGCFHETQQIFEDGRMGRIYGKDAPDILTTEDTFSTLSPLHTSSLVFRNILGELPDWFGNVVSGDMALFSIISAHGPLKKISKIMSVYYKHSDGLTNTAFVKDSLHEKRIELMKYLNEFHNYKFNGKALEVIEFHKKNIIDAQKKNNVRNKNNVLPDWHNVLLPEPIKSITTMLSVDERKLLYMLGKDYWKGIGSIIDAGCFLGGSTIALAMGVIANKISVPKEKVIHSYDLFIADNHQADKYLKKFGSFSAGDSIRTLYDANTLAVKNLLEVHEGNLITFPWSRKEIELLFIDVSKTWELNDFIIEEFFSSLIPNHSILIQQDFVHPTCPWLAITMEYFEEYFEPLVYVPNNTFVYRYIKKIPSSMLRTKVIGSLPDKEKLNLMDNAVDRYKKFLKDEDLVELDCARAILNLWINGVDESQRLLIEINQKYKNSKRLKNAVDWVEKRIADYKSKPCHHDKYLNIDLIPENLDLYYVRTSIKKVLDNNLKNFKGILLDLGCGQMPYRNYILANSNIAEYIGIDIENPTYQKTTKPDLFWDGNTIPLTDNFVDTVIATEVFEHVPQIEAVLKEIYRVLKPGGILFFTVPYLWPLHDVPYDEYRYTPYSLKRHLKNSGFDDIDIKPMGDWNTSLAQMLGLWLKRAPMDKQLRNQFSEQFFPFYKKLLESESNNTEFKTTTMFNGICGLVKKNNQNEVIEYREADNSATGKFPRDLNNSFINENPVHVSNHEEKKIMQNSNSVSNSKIIIIQGGFPAVSATFILDQITGLIDRGVEIENWATYNTNTNTIHEDIEKYDILNKTKFITTPPEKLKADPQKWLQKFMQLNNINNFDDVRAFHVHYGSNFNYLEPIFKLLDKYVLVSFHGYDASRYFLQHGDNCYKYLYERANRITTPSHFMKNELVKRGCDPEKIIIHRYGIDLERFSYKDRLFKKNKIVFLTVGRFVEKKGIEYSLEAYTKIHQNIDSEYRIIGEGDLQDKYLEIINNDKLQEKVKFLGPKTKDEVIAEMKMADVFVLTSVVAKDGDSEGVPVSLTEAHAIGLPVISTLHAGIPELVINGKTGSLSDEKDVESIAKNMMMIASDYKLRESFSKNAVERTKDEFNIVKLNDKLYSMLIHQDKIKNKLEEFEELLGRISWKHKYVLYKSKFSGYERFRILDNPSVSIIVISWRFHPDNLKNFQILEKQRNQNFELIFVDNGAKDGEFDTLMPYIDTYVKLNTNTGAYLARNIGAVFAQSSILVFLEDDGIPTDSFVKDHLDLFNKYEIIGLRGKDIPKTDNETNKKQKHYDLGELPIPYYLNLEGNCSIIAKEFFNIGGWDDDIIFGYGGGDLAYRLNKKYPGTYPTWYFPSVSIYHDYSNNINSLNRKIENQENTRKRLDEKNPGFTNFLLDYQNFKAKLAGSPDLQEKAKSILNQYKKRNKDFIRLLEKKNWERKKDIYLEVFEEFYECKKISNPSISIIVISWRLHPDNLKSFQILEKQRNQNFELIFVDNGGKEGEFEALKPYIDTYVKLNQNTGAYLARNIGAVFANAPILFFLEDDGIPEHNLVEAHLQLFDEYEIIACRGVYIPKTNNPLNKKQGHYYISDKEYPTFAHVEGNTTYLAEPFFKVGGWDDEIRFGGGGQELYFRLLTVEPDKRKQIYSPRPIIYHDYVKDEEHLKHKLEKQRISTERLRAKYPEWDEVHKNYRLNCDRDDLLIRKSKQNQNNSLATINQVESKFKRILFINHNLYPFENSGTPISTANHALGMEENGLEVAVLIPSAKVKEGFEKSSEEKYILYKVPRLDKFAVFLGEIDDSALARYFSAIEKIIEDFSPEIVQINDYVFMPEKIISLFRDKGVKVVRNVCNLEEICHMDSPVISNGLNGVLCSGPETPVKCAVCFLINHAGKKQNEIDPVLVNEIANRIKRRTDSVQKLYSDYVDGVIFTSEPFKDYYTRFINIDRKKIKILPRGINFNIEKVSALGKNNSNELRFAFIGNLQFVKGPDVLLNAFTEIAFLENFRLDIYGAIVDKAYKGWIKQLEEYYPDKFKYHGSFKKDDLAKIAASVDVVIVPSYFDTYNRIVRELLYLGVPMIVTDFFGSSIIQNYVNGIKIGVGDYKALASEMEKLIDNPSLIDKLSSGIANTKIPSLNDEISGMINFYNDINLNTERINETVHEINTRCIAFYLPQFHPIPENDKWWGKGFTEWTNVAKSQPLFEGHYQPQLPSELGFYDLRLLETQKEQARLAKENGIYGFCYYHYWFNGKRLLETPLTNILKSGEPDFPFCLCWANEDWTRAWDGKSGEILIAQNYSEEDDKQHMQFLSEIFKDKRYIRINGKPLFLVYKASRIPDPLKTTSIWRNEARKLGIGEIYLCRVESFKSEKTDPAAMGFDAAVEFQPDWSELGAPSFKTDNFKVYDYGNVVDKMLRKPDPGYKRFPCVTPSWDNSPRRKNNVAILHNSTPDKFKYWMSEVLKKNVPSGKDENLIFINAWNEWGEGAHLEPDTKFGKAYLDAVKQTVLGSSTKYQVSKSESALSVQEEYKTQASIIIPVWNKMELTKQCIDALLKNTAVENCEVIIVDNNSTDGTKDYLKNFEMRFKIIYNDENLGFSKACNLGAKAASGNYLVFLNNDTVPQKYWLEELISFIDAEETTGIVGCKLLYPDDTIQHCGVSMRHDKKYFRHHYKFLHKDHPLVNEVREYDAVTAACFITPKKLFFELGMFGEEFLNGCEDMDYCTRVREKGYRIYYNPASVLYHLESQTPRPVNMDDKNFARYIQKWGADRMKNEIEIYAEDGFWQNNGNTYTHQNNPLIGEWLEEVKSATARLDKEKIEKIRKIVKRIYPVETWTKYEISKNEFMLPAVTPKTNITKVLFVLHDFPVYRPAGAQLFALSLAKHINSTGQAQVEIIYPVFRASSRKDYSVDKLSYEGITVYELHKEKVNEPGKLFDQKIGDVFDEILKNNKYDLIHIHGLGQLTMAPIFAAEKNSVKMIMTLHDFWFLCDRWHMVRKNQDICLGPESIEKCAQCYIEDNNIPDTEKSIEEVNKYKKIRKEIFQGAYSCVNRFYSPSGYLKSVFNKYGFDRIKALPYGLDCEITHEYRNQSDDSKIIFGYAGQMIIRKGVDFLIEAFKSLPKDKNIELHVYGPLKVDDYSLKIKGMIESDERIKYFGEYDKKDVGSILHSFDVLVMPSLMDNYPIILQEAHANKTPVIASDVGGIPEMVSNMETGILVKPGSVDKLAEAMNLVIDNKELLGKFRNNIRTVKTIGESAIEYLNEYADVINEKSVEPVKSGNLTLQFYVYKSVHWPMFEELYHYVKKQPQVKEIVFCLPNITNLVVGGNYELVDKLMNMGHRCVSHPQDANADVTFIADTISGKVHDCGKIVNVGHGTISKGYYFTESFWTERENWVDLLCVPGDYAAEQFKQILKIRVAPTGMPKLDPVFRGDYNRENLCRELNLNPDKKIVLYAPTFNIDLSSLYILADDFHLLDKNDFYVLIKLHGSTPNDYIKKYRDIAGKSKNIKFIEDPNLARYIGGADVMISDVSSAFMEFMALDKPVILFDNPNTEKYHGYDPGNIEYAWRELGTRVCSFDQMLKELKRILVNGDDKSEIRKKYAGQLFADLKGNASENVWRETLALFGKSNVERPVISIVLFLNSDNSIFIRKLIHTIKFYSVMPIEFIFVKSDGKPCDDLIDELRNSGEYYSLKIIERYNGIDPILEGIKNAAGAYVGIIDEDVYLYKNFDYIIYKSFMLNPEVKVLTGLTESDNTQLNFKNYISADSDTKPDRFAYEFINKYQGKGSKKLSKISAAPPLIFIRRESFNFNAVQSYPEFINSLMKKGEFYVSPSLFYTLRNKNAKNDIIKLWNLRFLLKPEERLNIIKNLMNHSLYPELFELMFEDFIRLKIKNTELALIAAKSVSDRFYDYNYKQKLLGVLKDDNPLRPIIKKETEIIRKLNAHRPEMKSAGKASDVIRVLFYFYKNVHIPILSPVYQFMKQNYPEIKIAFGYMRYAPEIRAGFTEDELLVLKNFGEQLYMNPQEFEPDITIIADSVYPFVQNCGRLVHVGHGLLSKGQYYTDTALARREESADLVCVPGEYHKIIMNKIITKPVVATGMAKLDDLFSRKLNRESVLEKYKLPPDYKYILFAPTFNDELSAIPLVMDKINEVIPDDKTLLLVKLHGSTKKEYKEMYRELFKKDARVIYIDEMDITPFMAVADVMISDVSSAMMEYASLDKPLILFNNPDWNKYQYYNPSDLEFKWRDIGIQVSTIDEMKKAVERSFAHPAEFAQKRKYYTDQILANKNDGGASKKITESALSLCASEFNKELFLTGNKQGR